MIRHGLAYSENVLDVIARFRKNDPKAYRTSPETAAQVEFVKSWGKNEQGNPTKLNRYFGSLIGLAIGSGYVVKSLEAALWAFYHSTCYEDGCLMAVNLGDDADTTSTVYGQIAGAFYGFKNIPVRWRDKVAYKDMIIDFALRLYSGSKKIRH